jgi:nucleotide-binding universal stress UspA family protein
VRTPFRSGRRAAIVGTDVRALEQCRTRGAAGLAAVPLVRLRDRELPHGAAVSDVSGDVLGAGGDATARGACVRTAVGGCMTGTIICAIEGSDRADPALATARRLARRFDARMLLVSIGRLEQGLAEEEHRLAAGDPVEAVVMIAAEEAADLIVVSARSGLLRRTPRSQLARELVALAPCPVIVVPVDAVRAFSRAASRSG